MIRCGNCGVVATTWWGRPDGAVCPVCLKPGPSAPKNRSNKPGNSRRRRRWRNLRAWAGRCALCGATENLTIDHVLPRARGGTNRMDNLQVLCLACNQEKGCR